MGRRTWAIPAVLAALSLIASGCNLSYPLDARDLDAIKTLPLARPACDTRNWAQMIHQRLQRELPDSARVGVTTPDLLGPDSRPLDVAARFHRQIDDADTITGDFSGLLSSAEVAGPSGHWGMAPQWPGFQPVQIPLRDGLQLSALLADPTGPEIDGSYVVLAHGIFGRQYGNNGHNIANALRAMGHHVLAVDLRGHGMTETLYPDYPMTFGADEGVDLIEIDHWLRLQRGASRVGLVGLSISSDYALLAAWIDSDPSAHEGPASSIFHAFPMPQTRPAFDGGMLLISPVVNLIDYADSMRRPWGMLESPVRYTFQHKAEKKLRDYRQPPSDDLWDFVRFEFQRSRWPAIYADPAALQRDLRRLLDFHDTHRLDHVRVPLLILESADDPVVGAPQAVTDLIAPLRNPNCGMILLDCGGHLGFLAASKSYQYCLMKAFFDPRTGPLAVPP